MKRSTDKPLAKKRPAQPRKEGSATHVSGGRGVRIQRSGEHSWERVGRRGAMLKTGKVATSPTGRSSTLDGPEGKRKLKPGSLQFVDAPKPR